MKLSYPACSMGKPTGLLLLVVYLLLMVLLPAVHLVVEFGDDAVVEMGCCDHAVPQDEHPSDDSSEHHEHDAESCAVCQLMLMPLEELHELDFADLPLLENRILPGASVYVSSLFILPEQARAPPFYMM